MKNELAKYLFSELPQELIEMRPKWDKLIAFCDDSEPWEVFGAIAGSNFKKEVSEYYLKVMKMITEIERLYIVEEKYNAIVQLTKD